MSSLLPFNVFGMIEVTPNRIWILARAIDSLHTVIEKIETQGLAEALPVDGKQFILFSAYIAAGVKTRLTTRQLTPPGVEPLIDLPAVRGVLRKTLASFEQTLESSSQRLL